MGTIVKSFNIRKYVSPGILPGTVVLKMDQFTFQGAEETWHRNIGVTITALAHANLDVEIGH